jgi:predicted small metal-binding protein
MMTVSCDCGWSFEGEEDDLVEAVQEHGRAVHNMEVSRDQALAMASPA